MTLRDHDPDAVLDYGYDWTDWLADGETITSHEVLVTGATLDSSNEASGVVTAWISGAQPGRAVITTRITTSEGRTDDRSIHLWVRDR